jgi:hypothetical protein
MRTSAEKVICYSKRILLGILATTLTACNIDFQIPVNQETHITFSQGGQAITEQRTETSKQLITTVNKWLSSHKNNWEIGLITRPHGFYFKGENFYVNVLNDEVSVKYCKRRHQCQLYIRKDNGLYYQLQNILSPVSKATPNDFRHEGVQYAFF